MENFLTFLILAGMNNFLLTILIFIVDSSEFLYLEEDIMNSKHILSLWP